MAMFYSAMGGRFAWIFWTTFLASIAATESLDVIKTFWLGQWAEQYDRHPVSEVNIA